MFLSALLAIVVVRVAVLSLVRIPSTPPVLTNLNAHLLYYSNVFYSQLSVLEIYNETVYDLMGEQKDREALSIKLNAQGQVHVKGLTRVDVHGMADVVSTTMKCR
jgi:hypothetical protein